MRKGLTLVAIGFLILAFGAIYALNQSSTNSENTESITSSPRGPMASTLSLTSKDFNSGGSIPSKYTCDGEQINPSLSISGIPEGTQSLALIMDDPDVPKALKPDGMFDHWTLFNIPASEGGSLEIPIGSTLGVVGRNSAGKSEYIGPCPPREYEPSEHRYFFRAYALNIELPLSAGASKAEVLKAMEGHIIAQTELMGLYKRP